MTPPITEFLGELPGYNIPLYVQHLCLGGLLAKISIPSNPLSVSSGGNVFSPSEKTFHVTISLKKDFSEHKPEFSCEL